MTKLLSVPGLDRKELTLKALQLTSALINTLTQIPQKFQLQFLLDPDNTSAPFFSPKLQATD